jgi:hypothetical protein
VIQILGMMKAGEKPKSSRKKNTAPTTLSRFAEGVKNITTFRSYALFVIVLLLRGIGAVMGLRVRPRLL